MSPASAVLPTCSLAVNNPQRGQCNQCGKALTGRQQRWCGHDCANFYGRNHWWTTARAEAARRSYVGTGQQAAGPICDQCGAVGPVEVNHVEPRNGGPYDGGCWNHQTNLQVLCHDCHVAETTRQIRERRGIPEGGRPSGPIVPPMDSLWGAW